MSTPIMTTPLEKAIAIIGNRAGLAIQLGISAPAVSKWRQCPSDRVLEVSRLTGWQVSPHELRPDYYPHPCDGLPESERASHGAA